MQLKGVIFDLDGTLVDSSLDFQAIRRELGLGPGPLLEAMALLTPERRRECEEVLDRHERAGAMRAQPFHGALQWLDLLDEREIPRAIFTRNARSIVELTLDRCGLRFEHIITRDDAPPKPDPAAIHDLCGRWGVEPQSVLLIGDYIYDMQAGRNAGTTTALVTRGREWEFAHMADHVWESLESGLNAVREWLGPGADAGR